MQRVKVDVALRAHKCQHNGRHKLERGDKRLKVTTQRSSEHYCAACALVIIERDIAKLQALASELRGSVESGAVVEGV
jgi:hypothetical protein